MICLTLPLAFVELVALAVNLQAWGSAAAVCHLPHIHRRQMGFRHLAFGQAHGSVVALWSLIFKGRCKLFCVASANDIEPAVCLALLFDEFTNVAKLILIVPVDGVLDLPGESGSHFDRRLKRLFSPFPLYSPLPMGRCSRFRPCPDFIHLIFAHGIRSGRLPSLKVTSQ